METKSIHYHDVHQTNLQGYVAYDNSHQNQRPAVLVVHDWSGCNEFAINKAKSLAELGYVGFAIDMYGEGRQGTNNEEKKALMQPLLADRNLLIQRIKAALISISDHPLVDSQRIAAIGFCFGGLCVLDLARSGADFKGVVSFHGLFLEPENTPRQPIKAKVLAIHGYDDPMVTHKQLIEFCDEMTKYQADWQTLVYGHTMHAFTNPNANDPSFGTVYNSQADKRSWIAMKDFLVEIFK